MADLAFVPLPSMPSDAAQVWHNVELFLDEHGLDSPRGVYDAAQRGWLRPVVEFAAIDDTHYAYRLDGSTLLVVEWETCCGEPGHSWRVQSVRVEAARG